MLGVNPFAPAFITDPYPLYAELRAIGPVSTSAGWILSRHADVMAALTSDSVGHLVTRPSAPPFDVVQRIFLKLNRPDHSRLRAIIAPLFTPRVAQRHREEARVRVARILETGARDGGLDVVGDLAQPVATHMLADLLGMGPGELSGLLKLSGLLARIVDPATSPVEFVAMETAALDLIAYLDEVFRSRRSTDHDDVLSRLAAAKLNGSVSREEAIATCVLLLIAGGETTKALMGTMVLALLTDDEVLESLRRHPEVVSRAIDEFARHNSPTQRSTRISLTDVDINGVHIGAGEPIMLLFGSANRDPDAFDEPDRIDFARKLGHHLGFGRGMHYCLGAHIARGNGGAILSELIRYRPRPAGSLERPDWLDMFTLRGLLSLPILL